MRFHARLALAAALAAACGGGEERRAAPTAAAPGDFAGLYQVQGYTTVRRSAVQRRIEGSMIVARAPEGSPEPYTATFDLETEFATPEGPIQADVIGSARAHPEGEGLVGSAETRIFMASVPGLDPTFAWIPGRLGPRIVSRFELRPGEEPTHFAIEIETEPAPGEAYEPTRTSLRARRAVAGERPQVATRP